MQRTIKLLALWNFLTDFTLFAPVAILYFTRVSGSYALGMSIFSIVFLASSILEVPTGIFADKIGRKKTMLAGASAGVLSTVLYAIGLSYWWLVAGAIFEGTARAFYSGNNNAYLHEILADHNQEHKFHYYLGKLGAMFQLALAISAIIGGFVANWSFTLVVWLNVIPIVLKLFITLLLPEPIKRPSTSTNIYAHFSEALRLFAHNKELRLFTVAGMFSYAIREAKYQFRAAFVSSLWPIWALGVLAFLSNVGATISFYVSGKVITRFKEYFSIVSTDIVSHILHFVGLLFPSVFSPLLLASTSLVYGVESVAKDTFYQKQFSEHYRSTMGSLSALGGSLLLALFSFGLGVLGDKVTPLMGLVIFQVLALFPSVIFFSLFWKQRKLTNPSLSPSN